MPIGTPPIVHCYTVCWNVEALLPYFLRHYSAFCERIVLHDNMSTDATRDLIRACPNAVLVDFDNGGQIDEMDYLRIKNHAYKKSRGTADYVIVADIDEFLYHPQLPEMLAKYRDAGVTLPRVRGFNMVSLFHPRRRDALPASVRRGRYSPMYSKRCVFSPDLEINYLPGAHRCTPAGPVAESDDESLKLLHYQYLGLYTVMQRYRRYRRRLSEQNRRLPYAVQYKQSQVYTGLQFLKNWLLARRVV
jgi:hypothetical protein